MWVMERSLFLLRTSQQSTSASSKTAIALIYRLFHKLDNRLGLGKRLDLGSSLLRAYVFAVQSGLWVRSYRVSGAGAIAFS
jgi:hypothetical protein